MKPAKVAITTAQALGIWNAIHAWFSREQAGLPANLAQRLYLLLDALQPHVQAFTKAQQNIDKDLTEEKQREERQCLLDHELEIEPALLIDRKLLESTTAPIQLNEMASLNHVLK